MKTHGFKMALILQKYQVAHGKIYHGKDKELQNKLVELTACGDHEGVIQLFESI